ncbi:MAG: hypothetical protein HOE80_02850 [Candidatus Magasanikbacteria bacterium]|jgi:DNA-directed RNA polymerase specialized sigma24 family protein|nr:hypothetical protein [Candidatus Magasanikbacteria bacterium]MBT4071637.1 hypothetical protein [Candidatus Magasanikbacteria bacterium]
MERGRHFEGSKIEDSECELEKSEKYKQRLLEFLYSDYVKSVIGSILQIKDPVVLESLISDIALRIVSPDKAVFKEDFFKADSYFKEIIKNKFIDYLRARRVNPNFRILGGEMLRSLEYAADNPEEKLIREDFLEVGIMKIISKFRKIFSESNNIEREVEILRMMFDGYTNTDIANKFGYSDAAIPARIKKWKKNMPELIEYFNLRQRGQGKIERKDVKTIQSETLQWIKYELSEEIEDVKNEYRDDTDLNLEKAVLELINFYLGESTGWNKTKEILMELGFNMGNARKLRVLKNEINKIAGYVLNYDVYSYR